jgi:predicted metal-dependent phosphoesterase TrpH
MRFELHCHSTCSDGTEAPERVASRAAERGVEVFALTDHDTCAGSALTVVPNARVLRAVEISCDHKGRTIHVLAFDRGGAGWAALEERITTVRIARIHRIRVMAARLEQRGVRIDVEPLIAEGVERSIGRPDLARLMVAGGFATSLKDAFSRHLFDGGPVDVPNKALSMADAIAAGRDAGAAMSLAHPHLYDSMSFEMVREYELGGIEAFYGRYDARERKRWIELADDRGLVCTAGSDWHGAEEPEGSGVQVGVDLPADRSDALLRWLT